MGSNQCVRQSQKRISLCRLLGVSHWYDFVDVTGYEDVRRYSGRSQDYGRTVYAVSDQTHKAILSGTLTGVPVFFAELRRRALQLFLEDAVKVGDAFETAHVSDFSDREIGLDQLIPYS